MELALEPGDIAVLTPRRDDPERSRIREGSATAAQKVAAWDVEPSEPGEGWVAMVCSDILGLKFTRSFKEHYPAAQIHFVTNFPERNYNRKDAIQLQSQGVTIHFETDFTQLGLHPILSKLRFTHVVLPTPPDGGYDGPATSLFLASCRRILSPGGCLVMGLRENDNEGATAVDIDTRARRLGFMMSSRRWWDRVRFPLHPGLQDKGFMSCEWHLSQSSLLTPRSSRDPTPVRYLDDTGSWTTVPSQLHTLVHSTDDGPNYKGPVRSPLSGTHARRNTSHTTPNPSPRPRVSPPPQPSSSPPPRPYIPPVPLGLLSPSKESEARPTEDEQDICSSAGLSVSVSNLSSPDSEEAVEPEAESSHAAIREHLSAAEAHIREIERIVTKNMAAGSQGTKQATVAPRIPALKNAFEVLFELRELAEPKEERPAPKKPKSKKRGVPPRTPPRSQSSVSVEKGTLNARGTSAQKRAPSLTLRAERPPTSGLKRSASYDGTSRGAHLKSSSARPSRHRSPVTVAVARPASTGPLCSLYGKAPSPSDRSSPGRRANMQQVSPNVGRTQPQKKSSTPLWNNDTCTTTDPKHAPPSISTISFQHQKRQQKFWRGGSAESDTSSEFV